MMLCGGTFMYIYRQTETHTHTSTNKTNDNHGSEKVTGSKNSFLLSVKHSTRSDHIICLRWNEPPEKVVSKHDHMGWVCSQNRGQRDSGLPFIQERCHTLFLINKVFTGVVHAQVLYVLLAHLCSQQMVVSKGCRWEGSELLEKKKKPKNRWFPVLVPDANQAPPGRNLIIWYVFKNSHCLNLKC